MTGKLLCIMIAFLFGVSNHDIKAQWNLIWYDEFTGSGTPDASKWKFEVGPNWYNGELQYYTNSSKNARVENGCLVIEARQEVYGGRNYTSSRINSLASWTYGKMEIKAKLTKGGGLWPALWMMPVDGNKYGGWPKCGEIDIMENWSWDPNGIFGTIHTELYNHVNHTEKQGHLTVTDPSANFHVYSIEWYENQISWYIDNKLYFTFYNEGSNAAYPFNHPFYLIFNTAIESSAPGQEGSWSKRTIEIDYVRVYSGPTIGPSQSAIQIPAKIEAENFTNSQGVRNENCSEGGQNVAYIEANDFMEYKINATKAGRYNLDFRTSSPSASSINVMNGSTNLATTIFPATGGWQTWQTISTQVNLSAGEHTIRLVSNGSFNINWLEFKDNPLALKKNTSENIKVNTSQDGSYLRIEGLPNSSLYSIDIINCSGISSKKWSDSNYESTLTYNISDLRSGVYLIRIQSNKEQLFTSKFIKL